MNAARTVALGLALGLAACAAPPGGSGPAAQACREKAYQDPEVKDIIMLSNSQLQQVRGPALIQLRQVLGEKTRNCLANEGIGRGGGVEPVKVY